MSIKLCIVSAPHVFPHRAPSHPRRTTSSIHFFQRVTPLFLHPRVHFGDLLFLSLDNLTLIYSVLNDFQP
ncbi:hypothetical protein PIB30_103624, partial [Stylosanthes scabra]|nr:hypothetical protein [Stylosanthes scabra]